MKRIEKIIQEYKQQLKDKGVKNIPEFVEVIIQSDITKGKYTRFLLDCFIAEKCRLEDLQGGLESTIGQAVSLFHKHKSKLPEEMRSIYKYASPGNLWSAVREFEQVLTGKEKKQSEKEKAYAETEFIYHDENTGFQIVSPLTEHSAKWWGKGTRWCTASEKNNQFKKYIKDAPLFIMIMPNGNKIQLWKYKDNIQFMDEADNELNLDYISENWSYLKNICLFIKNLKFIPEAYKSYEICKLSIQENSESLYYVPEKLKTPELCRLAVEQNGYALQFVSRKLKTPELCKLAIQQNIHALHYIPEEFVTYEIYKILIEQNVNFLANLPHLFITSELCKIAIQKDGLALKYVPEQFKTFELCKIAIEQNGHALQYIPKEKRTALKFVPKKHRTPELYRPSLHLKEIILPKNIPPDYTEQYNRIRSLFPKLELSYKT